MNQELSACHNQVMAFFRDLDESDYAGLVSRLTTDAIWHRQGKVLSGHADVLAALRTRSATQRIHHIITNLVADAIDPTTCAMRAYMIVVRYDNGKKLGGPAPFPGFENIRTTHIAFRKDNEDWLISAMRNDDISFAATP